MLNKLKFLFLLVLAIHIAVLAQFAGGSGTSQDPWLIRSASNLDSIRYYEGISGWDEYIYFKQISDIDLGVSPWNTDQGWLPIGTQNDPYSFVRYNGNGFNIKNLYINRPDNDYIGLFGNVHDIEIMNITLADVDITGSNFTGAFIGYSEIDWNNLYEAFVSNSSVSGSVTGTSGVGGIIGCANVSTVLDSYSSADVSGEDKVGGIIGECHSHSASEDNFLHHVYSIGKITGTGLNKGGIVGFGRDVVRTFDCYWDIETSMIDSSACNSKARTTDEMTYEFSDDTYLYLDFDDLWAEDLDSLNNGYPLFRYQINKTCPSEALNLTTVDSVPGGMVINISWNNPDTLINGEPISDLTKVYLYRDFELLQTYDQPQSGGYLSFTDTVLVYGFYTYKVIAENHVGKGLCARKKTGIGGLFGGGNGTESNPYEVRSANHLYNIHNYTDIDSIYFIQTNNISLNTSPWNTGKGWIPIGTEEKPFKGSYKGGYIYGLSINDPSLDHAGLFGFVENAVLDSLEFSQINITGNTNCGALAGSAVSSQISKCSVGYGTITGNERIGGLIGFSSSVISDCYSQGNVTGDSLVAGFVAVAQDSMITNCYSSGIVTGNVSTGGFSAEGSALLFEGCYWDTESSTQDHSAGGEGHTTMEMFEESTYVGWDFENLWGFQDLLPIESEYPIFVWQVWVGIENQETSLPKTIELSQNYPNPFNPTTKISYILPNGFFDNVKLQIFNTKGELIRTLVNDKQNSGKYSVEFNASDLNSGMYFYTLKTLNSVTTKKMILVK